MRRWVSVFLVFLAGPLSLRAQRDAALPPRLGQPADFSQVVGVFQIAAQVKPAAAAVEEPLTLTVTITGQAQPPHLPNRDRLQLFPDEMQRDFYVEPAGERQRDTTWEFDYRLRAKHAEVKYVPGLKLVSYNPRQRRYQTAYSEAIPVTITLPTMGKLDSNGLNVVQAPASFFDLARHEPAPRSPLMVGSPFQEIALITLPPLACWLGLRWLRFRRRGDFQRQQRRRRAVAQAAAALATTTDAQTKARLVTDYLRLRLELPTQEPTPAEIECWLKRRGVKRDLRERWRQFLQACDAVQFAPAEVAGSNTAGDLAIPLIRALEEEPCLLER